MWPRCAMMTPKSGTNWHAPFYMFRYGLPIYVWIVCFITCTMQNLSNFCQKLGLYLDYPPPCWDDISNLSRFVLRAPAAWTNVKRSQNASIRKEHFGHTLKHGSDFTKHDLLLVFMMLLQEVNVHILFKISKTEFDFLTLYITLAAIKNTWMAPNS